MNEALIKEKIKSLDVFFRGGMAIINTDDDGKVEINIDFLSKVQLLIFDLDKEISE